MHDGGVKRPGMRKAYFVAEHLHKVWPIGDGRYGGCSQKSMRQYWKEYQNVAHLWAGFRWCQYSGDDTFYSDKNGALGTPQISNFLGIAHCFMKRSLQLKTGGSRNAPPLLDKRKVWRIPTDVYLVPKFELTARSLPPWMEKRLTQYERKYDPYG